jgi:hypothetical protein
MFWEVNLKLFLSNTSFWNYSCSWNAFFVKFPAPDNAFPFLEADIVLDDDFHFIHHDVYKKQMEKRGWPSKGRQKPIARPHQGGQRNPVPAGRGGPAAGANRRGSRQKRAAVKRISKLWPDGVVPYFIDKNLGQ